MSVRALQFALLVSAGAVIVILFGLFATEVRLALLAAILAATALTASERDRPGGGWWVLLCAGAALSVAGLALSELSTIVGGLVAIVGAVAVAAGAAIGYPLSD